MSAEHSPFSEDDEAAAWLADCDDALAAGRVVNDATFAHGLAHQKEIAYLRVVREVLGKPGSTQPITADGAAQTPGVPSSAGAAKEFDTGSGRLGRFQIQRELGRGGCGVVFLAHDPQLGRDVALKVPRAETVLSGEWRERFQREGRAAAGLDHPNIVSLYEVGEAGPVDFLVYAYCSGSSLANWLGQRHDPVPFDEIATLTQTLATAVAYAHSRGVLHRDLKPANILLSVPSCHLSVVSADVARKPRTADNRPPTTDNWQLTTSPKITDFGLAKLIEAGQEKQRAVGLTRSGAIMGTPAYMAPEQADGRTKDIGAGTDVYGLGAILYELLTGRPPFVGETELDTLLAVRLHEPVAPRLLRPKVPRDLETICFKCLQKEPSKRYTSAQDLADDLQRYSRGEPVHARPVSTTERLVRWCRRNPRVAVLTGAVGFLVVLVTAGSLVAAVFLARAYQRADAHSDRMGQTVDRYLVGVAENEKLKEHGLEPLRRELLGMAREHYEWMTQIEGNSTELEARRGIAYLRLGQITAQIDSQREAISLYQRARDTLTEYLRAEPNAHAHRGELARTHLALSNAYKSIGQTADALSAAQDALSIAMGLVNEYPDIPVYRATLSAVHHNLGHLHRTSGRTADAKDAFESGLAIDQQLAKSHPDVPSYQDSLAQTHNALAILLVELGKPHDAARSLEASMTGARDLVQRYPNTSRYQAMLAERCVNLGMVHMQLGRNDKAEDAGREASAVLKKLVDRHPTVPLYRYQLGACRHNLGRLYRETQRFELGEQEFADAAAIWKVLVRDHADVVAYHDVLARTCHDWAVLYDRTDRTAEAEALDLEAQEIRKALVQKHPQVPEYAFELANTQNNLGFRANQNHQYGAALDWFSAARDTLTPIVSSRPTSATDALTVSSRRRLSGIHWGRAAALHRLGRFDEASQDWDAAIALDDRGLAELQIGRAATLARLGDRPQAIEVVEKVLSRSNIDANTYYHAASVYSLALTGVTDSSTGEEYAVRAVTLLKQAIAHGFRDKSKLVEDNDFAALRGRGDFQELVNSLDKGTAPNSPSR